MDTPTKSLLAIGAALLLAVPASVGAQATTVFRDVRLFDGERVVNATTVVVRDGRIAAIAAGAAVPAGAEVIDGKGRTLLPGFIDAHTHTMSAEQLRAALAFGVVAQLDQFTAPALVRTLTTSRTASQADLHSAGVLGTAPGGHGTQFGVPIPTLTAPADAERFVAERVAEGARWIKLVVDDASVYGMTRPTIDSATVAAVVKVARARGLRTVAHVAALASAQAVIGAGVDGLVHIWIDRTPSADLVRTMRERGVFVIPTMTVTKSVAGEAGSRPLLDDVRLASMLGPLEAQNLRAAFPQSPRSRASYDSARASLAALVRAGVPILAGSDAPNPGTTYGATMHRELELLVEAGMTPAAALRAATSLPARSFGIDGIGRIAEGAAANLVLVEGDPMTDITATRAIVGVWKDGVKFDRAGHAAGIAAQRRAADASLAAIAPGVVSDFEEGRPASTFGAGWTPTTDAMAGGTSTATIEVAPGGAAGTANGLLVRGTVTTNGASPWAGAMFFPATPPMSPADLSVAGGFSFHARGDGATYRVMVFTREGGGMPRTKTFVSTAEWSEHRFAWSDFATDGKGVLGVAIVAGPAAGSFELRLDRLALTAR